MRGGRGGDGGGWGRRAWEWGRARLIVIDELSFGGLELLGVELLGFAVVGVDAEGGGAEGVGDERNYSGGGGAPAAASATWQNETAAALNGVLLQLFNHGVTAGLLFAFVALIEQRSEGRRGLDDFGGLRAVAPALSNCNQC